ncbi:hypothetical protein FGG08_007104 [Glutinoglossum americanum]|uniref:Partial AB-hydrolase lipase domain-containing protein n=1 Tax=Glutinoglossum americanum TaxID=1670608 RepID=A0A9P8HZJ8_9PEZI|nr:hypothetical protein FGG08_007104 [Glutinoglossum americanum]
MAQEPHRNLPMGAEIYSQQAERLEHRREGADNREAVEAKVVAAQDPIIVTEDGGRLPVVLLSEAGRLNRLEDKSEGADPTMDAIALDEIHKHEKEEYRSPDSQDKPLPPSETNPLFPPLPLYGPPTLLRNIQCISFRVSSFFLSLSFLAVIVLGAALTSIPLMFIHVGIRLRGNNPNARRPFHGEEQRRSRARKGEVIAWKRKTQEYSTGVDTEAASSDGFEPTEGGKDKLVCDIGYYARRVGLDVEEFKVETQDGFLIVLWHVYDPKEYSPSSGDTKSAKSPEVPPPAQPSPKIGETPSERHGKKKYPVLLLHGLLQSAGAYCTNDDDSLAFFLCKSGYDVWLGNNRCGFKPEHTVFSYSDPRMWTWNIREMGVLDLPAFISRVLSETGLEKLGLISHSQGTTEAFVALAKGQRPDLGEKISVFCALAPAVYAGPLVGKIYFKFMRVISPRIFRIFFGIHAFIPLMMTMHAHLPSRLYGALGYRVFSFLFNWTDNRWDLGLRDRQFLFAPVYVSSESMRWWLGRECFAKQKCILATKEQGDLEEADDREGSDPGGDTLDQSSDGPKLEKNERRVSAAWYNEQFPPLALWIAGSDDLVDGRRLLKRFKQGREPLVKLVHAKVIDEYEHLDVLWAVDSVEKVATEIREVIWKTLPEDIRNICRVPEGCQDICGQPAGWKKNTGLN